MAVIVITGSDGFIGKNLSTALKRMPGYTVRECDISTPRDVFAGYLKEADIVYHLAGINRPPRDSDFTEGNVNFTQILVDTLTIHLKKIPVVFTSSSQALLDNPYGKSKKAAEDILLYCARATGSPVYIYRLPNVFGKWCKPNYNSVVATFCHSIARHIDISISDETKEMELAYIDDIVAEFIGIIGRTDMVSGTHHALLRTFKTTLGELAKTLFSFRDIRATLTLPDLADDFTRFLYSTYLSYLDTADFSYALDTKSDQRGVLAELLKSPHFGQIFISRTHPGVTRGNHYHDTKIEKFCVVEGTAVIKFRHILDKTVISYAVTGDELKIVDIPPGYTHCIENTGNREMVVLFWANVIFDKNKPDTYYQEVQ
ncbi:MAG: NAD-dependent epimerase/dehydratase family protein [Elusimicrobia bacterium]|nr:NAD-dependent epimerase/dehydratase family protein [Elusimicrobiota bacterium]